MFTRVACDPLIGRRGSGRDSGEDDDDAQQQQIAQSIQYAQEMERMAALADARKVGKPLEYLTPEEEQARREGRFEEADEEVIENVDLDAEMAEIVAEAQRNKLDLTNPLDAIPARPTSNNKGELLFVSGMMEPELERGIAGALDSLCPALESTPKLQDKALRAVFSVGVDAVMMDSELSAMMGKIALTKTDVLRPQETLEVFSGLILPEDLFDDIRALEEY